MVRTTLGWPRSISISSGALSRSDAGHGSPTGARRAAGSGGSTNIAPALEPRGGSSAGAMFVLPPLPAARLAPVGDPWPASLRDSAPDEIEMDLGQPRVVRTIGFPLRWHYRELD